MENQRKPISENAFVEFFKGLDENYQRYCIEEIKRKVKKPPDSRPNTNQADSAGLVGGPVSPLAGVKAILKKRGFCKMENDVDVIIFLKDGKTLRFQQVKGFYEDEEGWVGFVYQGVSTEKERVAVFYIANIAGYAIDSKGVEEEE